MLAGGKERNRALSRSSAVLICCEARGSPDATRRDDGMMFRNRVSKADFADSESARLQRLSVSIGRFFDVLIQHQPNLPRAKKTVTGSRERPDRSSMLS